MDNYTEKFTKRFWSNVAITSNSEKCWEWQASFAQCGYGKTSFKRKFMYAHRMAWFITHSIMPTKFILHSCDNRKCVNPNHLREGTQAENMRDMAERNRSARHWGKLTHCKNGHEFTEKNTYIIVRDKSTKRICRKCNYDRYKQHRIRKIKEGNWKWR